MIFFQYKCLRCWSHCYFPSATVTSYQDVVSRKESKTFWRQKNSQPESVLSNSSLCLRTWWWPDTQWCMEILQFLPKTSEGGKKWLQPLFSEGDNIHSAAHSTLLPNSPSSLASGLLRMESHSERHGETGGRLGATLHTTTPLLMVPGRILGDSGWKVLISVWSRVCFSDSFSSFESGSPWKQGVYAMGLTGTCGGPIMPTPPIKVGCIPDSEYRFWWSPGLQCKVFNGTQLALLRSAAVAGSWTRDRLFLE